MLADIVQYDLTATEPEPVFTFASGTIATHNGNITVQSPSGDHRVFKIWTQPDDASFAPGSRAVAVEEYNFHDARTFWRSFGFVNPNGTIRVFKKRQYDLYPAYARMLANPEPYMEKGFEFLFSGTCRKCNRELTNPESIRSGIGPICAGRS